MPLDDRTILVVGGTGMLGQPVVNMLDYLGFPVRILTRNRNKAEKIFGRHFDIAEGDIENYDSLLEATSGCYGVHVNLKGGPKDADFMRIEYGGSANVVRAAVANKLKKITYLSGASVTGERCRYSFVRAKYEAEQAIIKSGLKYSIFRATWFLESLPLFIRGNQAIVMGRQPHKIHWLAAEDYAQMVARSYLQDDANDKIFTIFGPESYTFYEALDKFCRLAEIKASVVSIPIGVLSFWAFLTFSRQLKDALKLMRYYDKYGEAGDPTEADEILGAPQTTLEEWLAKYQQAVLARRESG